MPPAAKKAPPVARSKPAPRPKAPTSPGRYSEAVQFFRARVPMSERKWLRLTEEARLQGFKVAGVAKLDMIAAVHKAIDQAVNRGDTLDDFKRKIGPKLIKTWGGTVANPAARLETIFRTNMQHAYNAGRVRQLQDPAVLKARPYWTLLTILDGRTSEVCRRLKRVILPATHPFWRSHIPPLHFQCRTTIQALTVRSAAARGISKRSPSVKADTGFGTMEPWKPDLTGYPPVLARIYRSRR